MSSTPNFLPRGTGRGVTGLSFPRFLALGLLLVAAVSGVAAGATGGPDAFGYTFTDTSSGGISYAFEDISATGTQATLLTGQDEAVQNVPIGFTFNHYGNPQTVASLSTNGFIAFNNTNPQYINQSLPTPGAPDAVIAGWWDDLNLAQGGTVFYSTLGTAPNRRFIVQFHAVKRHARPPLNTFQFKLFEGSHNIEIHYANVENTDDVAIGIENADGSVGLQYFLGSGSPFPTPFAILFSPPSVANTNHSGAGSLRQAILDASAGAILRFAPSLSGGTIPLSSEIVLNKNITVDASTLPLGLTLSGSGTNRIFTVNSGQTVLLKNLTLTGGTGTGAASNTNGGAIYNNGTLALERCLLSGNSAAGSGGAIFNNIGKLLTLTECTFHANSTTTVNGGGAILNQGSLTASRTTFSNNTAAGSGGAIQAGSSTTTTLTHCTLAGNSCGGGGNSGGAIRNNGTLTLTHCTLSGNSMPNVAGASGGIYNEPGRTVTLAHCILHGNIGRDIFNNATLTVTDPSIIGVIGGPGTSTGTILTSNPLLAPLGNYGGPTQTMPPRIGSPAIDPAGGATTSASATDQRGFPRLTDGNSVAGVVVDIGAVEAGPLVTVTNASDSGPGSLRAAIDAAAAADTRLTFAALLDGATITLTGGPLGGAFDIAPWTGDASSGISSSLVYTHAYNFGSAASPVLNGVTFTGITGGNPAGPNFTLTGPATVYNGAVENNLPGGSASETLANDFLYTGNPAVLTLTGLTPGRTYRTTFFSFGWENPGVRIVTFSANGQSRRVDQGAYGLYDGIRVGFEFVASATSQAITVTPSGVQSFHFCAFANAEIPSAKSLWIDATGLASGIIVGGNDASRVFDIAQGQTASIAGLTVTGGFESLQGGGIRNQGNLNLFGTTVSGNRIIESQPDRAGGGIHNTGNLLVSESTVSGNSLFFGNGGGIYNSGSLVVVNSTISGNLTSEGSGGGIANYGTATLLHATLSGNSVAFGTGGGIFAPSGNIAIGNSIVAGNTVDGSSNNIQGSYSNSAGNVVSGDARLAPLGNYGGRTRTMPPRIGSPAINAATGPVTFAADQRGAPRQTGTARDLGAVEAVIDTLSPVPFIDFANPQPIIWTGAAGATFQMFFGTAAQGRVSQGNRTSPFTPSPPAAFDSDYVLRIDTTVSGVVYPGEDISFSTRPMNPVVTTLADENDGFGIGDKSLREALAVITDGETLTFAPALSGGTITLGSEIVLNKNITVDASTLPAGLTVSGGPGTNRLFTVNSGTTVALTGLTLTDGNGGGAADSGNGGAILNYGTLALTHCTLEGNAATGGFGYGGAIANFGRGTNGASLTLTACTITGNTSTGGGGGIACIAFDAGSSAPCTLLHCTLVANSTPFGGAIYTFGAPATNTPWTITHCTIAANTGTAQGGGIQNQSQGTLTNSIISGNTSPTGADLNNPSGMTVVRAGANIVPVLVSTGTLSGPAHGTADPLLAPLGDYGGPTRTMPPGAGSPAIDAGGATGLLTDQRGFPRVIGGTVDIGAVETGSADFNPSGLTLTTRGPATLTRLEISTNPGFLNSVGTFSGTGSTTFANGPRASATFNHPSGVAEDSAGNLYVADTGNHRIRKIDKLTGEVSTIAGTGAYGFADGNGLTTARFAFPAAVAVTPDGGIVYVSDTINHRIRKLTKPAVAGQPWTVTTLAGTGVAGHTEGAGSTTRFNHPHGLVVDASGNIFVADSLNHRIRKVTPGGVSSTYAGSGIAGSNSLQITYSGGTTQNAGTTVTVPASVPTGALAIARVGHTATLLNSGQVLVVGGQPTVSAATTSVEVYDPATGTWSATGALTTARHGHTATLLNNGKVLVVGGQNANNNPIAAAELFDPATGTWSATAALATSRFGHTATLLNNGKVLVVGGQNTFFDPITSAALYDPATGTWTATAALAIARNSHSATLLNNGKVLVVGGQGAAATIASTELYDPATGTWSVTAALATARHRHTATLLGSGSVLVVGGKSGSGLIADTALYHPATGTWSPTAALATARAEHTATLLNSGKVLVVGGEGLNFNPTAATELYDPATNTRSADVFLTNARQLHTATLLNNGSVLFSGGLGLSGSLASAELYGRPTSLITSGLMVSGPNIAPGTTVASITDDTTFVLSKPATASGSGLSLTVGPGVLKQQANFNAPFGLAFDSSGNLFVADSGNHAIRRIDRLSGIVTGFAGGSTGGFQDSPALFKQPVALAIDSEDNLYVSDQDNHAIRKITSAGVVTTVAPVGIAPTADAGFVEGISTIARFDGPSGLLVASDGFLMITDTENHRLRRVSVKPLTVATTHDAGTGTLSAQIDAAALGLDPGQTYYFRWLPEGGGTPVAGTSFQLLLPPTVVTAPATLLTSTGGQLNASVNPQGSNTAVIFEYSTDPDLRGPWQVATLPPNTLTDPQGVAVFGGITYVADQAAHAIYKVSTQGVATLFAGAANGAPGFANGTSTDARFDSPTGLAVDADGNLYVADRLNHRIRKITPGGVVSTLAGSGLAGFADGAAGSARFLFPQGVAVFEDNVYVADTNNHRIRRIDRSSGAVTSLAGNGTAAFADGAGTSARFSSPRAVAVDASGQVHVADTGNHAIRLLAAGNSVVTLAGDGTAGFLDGAGTSARLNSPAGLAIAPDGTLYVTDQANHRVRSITSGGLVGTVAGSGSAGLLDSPAGSLHPASAAKLDSPGGIALDSNGDLVLSEDSGESNRLRRIVRAALPTLATHPNLTGTASVPVFSAINQPLLPGATYYFRAVAGNGRAEVEGGILSFTTPESNIVVHNGPTADSPVLVPGQEVDFGTAPFNTPMVRSFTITNIGDFSLSLTGVTLSGPQVGVFSLSGQTGGSVIAAGASGTFHVTMNHGTAGTFTKTVRIASNDLDQPVIEFPVTGTVLAPPLLTNVAASDVTALSVTFAGTVNSRGSATEVLFEYSKYPDFAGVLEVLTTSGSTQGFANGCGGAAQFNAPSGVAVDPFGNIYVADTGNHRIRRIAANGDCTVLAGSGTPGNSNAVGILASFNAPEGVAADAAGNIYVADTGNHLIRRITPGGVVTTVAGFGSAGAFTDGIIIGARFNSPAGIAIDATGNLFIADTGNNRIRQISTEGEVSTFAGPAGYSSPKGVAVDREGRVCVADTGNDRIVELSALGVVTDTHDTGFNGPTGVAMDAAGLIHVADRAAHRIARIHPGGSVTNLAGTPDVPGANDGTGTAAKFDLPTGIAVSPSGTIYIADFGNHRVRQINLAARRVVAATHLITAPDAPITLTLVGLEPNTTYYYRGIAINGGGTVYTDPVAPAPLTFTTLDNDAGLAELTLNGTPVPNFSPCAYSYAVTIDPPLASMFILAEASSPGALMGLFRNGQFISNLESGVPSAPLPLAAGLNPFQIVVLSADGTNSRTYSVAANFVQPQSGFPLWQALKFGADAGNPLIAGELADPDHDGSANVLEYAFDLDPNASSPVGLPFIGREGGFLSITYRRLVGATDLDYTVQWSTDLVDWFDTGIIEELATPQGAGLTEEIRARTPDDGPRKFLRVSVQLD